MAAPTPDLVVIGGGVTGTATALAAARRGLRTVLLERFQIGHRHGSSHGPSRIIRLAYHAADYIELAREALVRWRELEQSVAQPLLRPTGGLDCGMPGTSSLEQTIQAMRQAGVSFESLSFDDLSTRFPQINFDPGTAGVYQPDAAVLDADRCVRALAERACHHGVEIREQSLAQRIESTSDTVKIVVNNVEFGAGAVVVTAGSWAARLLTGLGPTLALTVTREQVGYFTSRQRADFEVGQFPLVLEHNVEGPPLRATFPRLPPYGWVKSMFHRNGPTIDPDNITGEVNRDTLADLVGYVGRRFRGLGRLTDAETCRYTMTPDEDFVLDLVPGHPRVAVASACSGHGFKFGPVLGEVMVDLVTTGTSERPIGRFAIDRPTLNGGAIGGA